MIKIIFSDIDGTLAHYPKHFNSHAKIVGEDHKRQLAFYEDRKTHEIRICNALPSKTSGNGYVSIRTIELVEKIKKIGIIFVLISGARSSTFFKRLHLLPHANIAIAENGGLIYENGKEDRFWTKKLLPYTGDAKKGPLSRNCVLWEFYSELIKQGWNIDATSYFTCFRIDLKKQKHKNEKDLIAIIKELPKDLSSSFNLGKADFYPKISGKGNALRYILQKKKILKKYSAVIMDDDNDLPMTLEVDQVFIPGITNKSVQKALKTHPNWIVAKNKGILGTEEILERILDISRKSYPTSYTNTNFQPHPYLCHTF